jgi:GAF domain-containing protein
MAEDLILTAQSKAARYQQLIPQLKALCAGEENMVANLANIAAGLKESFDFFWVGFYLTDTPDELVLGPFQGPVACTRIRKGKGVCGSSWEQQKTLRVPNVEEFPGHIACSSLSKSEIVVPIYNTKRFIGVLDVDSDQLNDFDEVDERYLTEICKWIATLFK